MGDVEGMGEALFVAVHDNVDVTLTPMGDVLGAMLARLDKAEPRQNLLERLGTSLVHGELDELDLVASGARRKLGQIRDPNTCPSLKLIQRDEQRALTVERNAASGSCPEAVVEDLKGQESIKSRRI